MRAGTAVGDLSPSWYLPLWDVDGKCEWQRAVGPGEREKQGVRVMPVGAAFLWGCGPEMPAQGRPLLCLSPALWGVPCSGIQLPSLLADLWPP